MMDWWRTLHRAFSVMPGRMAARSLPTAHSVARREAMTHFSSSGDLMQRASSMGFCASTMVKPWDLKLMATLALRRSRPTVAFSPTRETTSAAISAVHVRSRSSSLWPAHWWLTVCATRISSMVSRPAARWAQPWKSNRIERFAVRRRYRAVFMREVQICIFLAPVAYRMLMGSPKRQASMLCFAICSRVRLSR